MMLTLFKEEAGLYVGESNRQGMLSLYEYGGYTSSRNFPGKKTNNLPPISQLRRSHRAPPIRSAVSSNGARAF